VQGDVPRGLVPTHQPRPYKETSDVFPPKFRPITLRRIDDVIQNCSDDVISVRTSLPRVSKNAGGRPRLASVASDGRYMGLAL